MGGKGDGRGGKGKGGVELRNFKERKEGNKEQERKERNWRRRREW